MSDQYRSAVVAMPTSAQLGGEQPLPFVRFPFFPTSPWYSTNPNVGYQVRYYSTGINRNDGDYQVGSEMIRTVQFDIPVRLIAINGAAVIYDEQGVLDLATMNEQNMNLSYLFRAEYTTGDKLHTAPRLASSVVGTARNPGEIGGHGYNIDQGASLVIGITPLIENLKIDISLQCLEMRAPRNYAIR
jgi:hypothetical protein